MEWNYFKITSFLCENQLATEIVEIYFMHASIISLRDVIHILLTGGFYFKFFLIDQCSMRIGNYFSDYKIIRVIKHLSHTVVFPEEEEDR